MSYLLQSDHNNQNPRPSMPTSPFDPYASHPSSQSSSFVAEQPALPKVGQTRCYWALLSSDLQFIYLDPVLAHHLEEQAEELVGKSLLTFVHPDEQTSAKQDLGSVLDSRTLHGSVTRVRFSRLSRVRRELGYKGTPHTWSDADKIALDSNYMAVDIVINWAAEGLVLCFIHATVDLAPSDNDEQHKTGWTNWCGTPLMTIDQIQLLFRRLIICIPQTGTMTRVFQILSNHQDRPLMISWPPDQGQGPTGRDFAKLVEDVQIGPGVSTGNEAKTSCTRRYKALQSMPAVVGEVESIFIPHGSVIFACHKVNAPSPRNTASASPAMQHIPYNATPYAGQQHQQPHQQSYYDHQQGGPSYGLPPLSTSPASAGPYPNYNLPSSQSPAVTAPYSPSRWSQQPGDQQPPPPSATTAGSSYSQWNSSSPHSTSNLRSGSYPPPQGQQWPNQSSPYVEGGGPGGGAGNGGGAAGYQPRPLTPSGAPGGGYGYGNEGGGPGDGSDVVPPPRRRVSPESTRDSYGPGGRSGAAGNRPMGVLKCSSCKATQSPEWRKGPSGKKELCNACGLRYARSRAKKEGHNATQRRRKDKSSGGSAGSGSSSLSNAKQRASGTPPTPSSNYSALRRNYDEGSSFSSGGTSPSPPSTTSNMSFVHYSPGPSSSGAGPSSFYSAPSPLATNPPVRLDEHAQHPHPHHHHHVARVQSFERDAGRELLPPTPVSAEPRHQQPQLQQGRRSILTQQ